MDQIHRFSRHLLNANLPRQEERADEGGSFVGIGIAYGVILALVILSFVSSCKCSISLRNLSSNNQPSPTTSSSCSHEPNTQTHQELVALPIFVFGEQTPPSISGTITLPQLSSSKSSSSFVFSDGDCAICLGDYVHGEFIRVLPRCKHMFHKDCIDQWLSSRTSSCPICRNQIIDKNVVAGVTGPFTLFPFSNGRIQNYL